VELPVNAHIPHDYIPGERLRLEAYTQIAAIDSELDVTAITDELSDRYGEPPERSSTCSRWPGCAPPPGGPACPTSPRPEPHQVRAGRTA